MQSIFQSLRHPRELVALVKSSSLFCVSNPSQILDDKQADESYLQCYTFLNLTSRSFARVIQELDPNLRHAVCLFYLVLRALDTIEDDMTIPFPEKRVLLIDFHNSIGHAGWTFDGNSPGEKDRVLLVNFHHVVTYIYFTPSIFNLVEN